MASLSMESSFLLSLPAKKKICPSTKEIECYLNRVATDRAHLRLRRRVPSVVVELDSKAPTTTGPVTTAVIAVAPAGLVVESVVVVSVLPVRQRVAAAQVSERRVALAPSASVVPSLKVRARITATEIVWCGRWPSIPLVRLTLKRRRPA